MKKILSIFFSVLWFAGFSQTSDPVHRANPWQLKTIKGIQLPGSGNIPIIGNQADTIIYLSRSGVVGDADISAGSIRFGVDNTTAIQNILNLAGHTKSLKLIWDVKVSVTGLRIKGNTWIEALPGKGAILRNNSNKSLFINYDTVFASEPQDSNIMITGGIWNGNNYNAGLNPAQVIANSTNGATNVFSFIGVRNLTLRDFTILRQRAYAVNGINIKHGLYENGIVDGGAGVSLNGDGLHFNGHSEHCVVNNIVIKNTGDDGIALNADDQYMYPGSLSYGYYPASANGPISDISISNISLGGGMFGVRLLSGISRIDNIRISNITGTTKGYAVIIDNYWQLPSNLMTFAGAGNIGTVQISNVDVNITDTVDYVKSGVIVVNCNADKLILKDLKRDLFTKKVSTLRVSGTGTVIKSLVIDGYDSKDISSGFPHIWIDSATVNNMSVSRASVKRTSVVGNLIENSGTIGSLRINGVLADTLKRIIYNRGVINTISAVNILHDVDTTFKTLSTIPNLVLSNWIGNIKTSGTFTNKYGDAFSSTIKSIMFIPADTSMFADSTFGRIYSDGFVIDTLIFTVNSAGTSSVKLAVYYGTDWTSTGTAVVTAFNTITAEGVKTKISSFNNATVAAGNYVWIKMKGAITAKYWSVQIKGHSL